MRYLEQGREAEGFGEVGLDAGEHVVVEEDIALDLLGQVLNRAGVGEAELRAPLREGVPDI